MTITEQMKRLCDYFRDKATHLQKEIDMEIEKIGGEIMLLSREDLIHWVYYARDQVETYRTICRMLEDKADGVDTEGILQELRETMEEDKTTIDTLLRKQEEEKKALTQLREEAEYYRLALDVLGVKRDDGQSSGNHG